MKIYHADHGISESTIEQVLATLKPGGFFATTTELPSDHVEILSALYGPSAGDGVVQECDVEYVRRSPDRPLSRMINAPKRPTRKLTLIGTVNEAGELTIFTAYGGPLAPREPGDPTLETESDKAEAHAFWSTHALASK